MTKALEVDPQQLAAELEATVMEFNALAMLAASLQMSVIAELHEQKLEHGVTRPVLMVRVAQP